MSKSNNRTKYLIKNTAIFAINNIATKLIVFLLVPLYTYFLTTSEYGVVDLLFTISSVLVPIFTLNVSEAIYRFSMDKDANNNKIISTSIILLIFGCLMSLVCIPILGLFPNYTNYKYLFYFYVVSSTFFQIFIMNLKGQEKLKEFAIGNILNTLLIALLNILFLALLKMKVEGYFLAYIISNFISSFYCIFIGKVHNNIKSFDFDKKLSKEMIKYSFVLVPTSFMWWIINSSDRIMVTNFISSSANGIYAVSYKIPSILTVIAWIFNQAWIFSAVNEKNSKDKEEYTNKVFNIMYIAIFIMAIGIVTFLKPFYSLYVSSDYYVAWKYVPILLFGSAFMTLGTFVSTSYNVYKDSKGMLFSGVSGALINVVLNFILIPLIGVFGAAIATCISYITVFIYRIIDTKKYVKIKLNKSNLVPVFLYIISTIFLYFDNLYFQIFQIIILLTTLFIYKDYLFNVFSMVVKNKKMK